MKKPYAESTLRRKYRETQIPYLKINALQEFLSACANFYKIIEIKDVWRIIGKKCGVTRAEFDTLLPIFSRDDSLSFYIEREDELYIDGKDSLLLIDRDYLIKPNPDFDMNELAKALQQGTEYDGPEPLLEDWDRFFELDKERWGKPLFVPADILPYADGDYIEQTPQVKAMRRFLEQEVKLADESIIPTEEGRTPAEQSSWWAIDEMLSIIFDLSSLGGQKTSKMLEVLEDMGYVLKQTQLQRCVDLFTDINNHTRMPCNRGFMPVELSHMSDQTRPKLSFGPGLRQSIQRGELDGEELKQAVLEQGDWPLQLRANLIKEVNSALQPGEERWIGGTLVKGEKISPNDPCPCGSGKKYKKCCGKK